MKIFNILIILSLVFFACGTDMPEKSDKPISEFLSVGDYKIDPDNNSDAPIPINYGDMVTGKISYIPENMHLWLVVYAIENGRHHPQQWEINPPPPENEWALNVFVGTPNSGVGEHFNLLLVFVNGEGDQLFQDYMDNARKTGEYSGMMDLPTGYKIIDSITVVRAENSDGPISEFLSVGDHEIDPLNNNSDAPIPINYGDMVTGRISYIPENMHLWLVVYPIENERYYPQLWEIILLPPENEWALNVFVGTPDSGVGEQFNLLLVFVNGEGNQFFRDYMDNAKETGDYSGMVELPAEHEIIDSITVVRTQN